MKKQLPKIVITRSWIYESHLVKPNKYKPFDYKVMFRQAQKFEKVWRKEEKKILTEISKTIGLPWNEKQINVYMTDKKVWFSKPLTLSVIEHNNKLLGPKRLRDILTHELIHRIWSDDINWKRIKQRSNKLMNKYKKDNFNVQIHVPVHAIHKHILLKLFSNRELQAEIDSIKKWKDYVRAWEIVERDDYKEIIKALNPKFR